MTSFGFFTPRLEEWMFFIHSVLVYQPLLTCIFSFTWAIQLAGSAGEDTSPVLTWGLNVAHFWSECVLQASSRVILHHWTLSPPDWTHPFPSSHTVEGEFWNIPLNQVFPNAHLRINHIHKRLSSILVYKLCEYNTDIFLFMLLPQNHKP